MAEKKEIKENEKKERKEIRVNVPGKKVAAIVIVAIVFFTIGFIIKPSEITGQVSGDSCKVDVSDVQANGFLSGREAAQRVIDYVNAIPDISGTLNEVKETSGIYEVNINIKSPEGENPVVLMVSKDGKILFPQSIDIDAAMEQLKAQQNTPQSEQSSEIPKSDRPTLDLFIFSFCPAGKAAETSLVPVGKLLSDKADINVKFFSHMHGEYERRENIRQECIQKVEPDKFWEYAGEFLESANNGAVKSCGRDADCVDTEAEKIMKSVNIDVDAVNNCIDTEGDSIYNAEVQEANSLGLRYSPSFLINGRYLPNLARTPDGIKAVLCDAFNTPPEECSQTLSASGSGSSGSCA